MKLYRIYGYLEVQVEADSEEEALEVFEEQCLDDVMSVVDIEEIIPMQRRVRSEFRRHNKI